MLMASAHSVKENYQGSLLHCQTFGSATKDQGCSCVCLIQYWTKESKGFGQHLYCHSHAGPRSPREHSL